jgi:hypothetical protein
MSDLIEIPFIIGRRFIQLHPEWIFLYGNDLYNKGCLGQAWFAFGEPNAFRVPTCRKICNNASAKFYFNEHLDEYIEALDKELALIPKDGRPIIPFRKMGEGCSRLKELGPKCYEYLQRKLTEICYPNYKYNYKWNSDVSPNGP